MEETAAAELRRSAFEGLEQAEVAQHLLQGNLRAQEGKIEAWTRRWCARLSGTLRHSRRRVDGGRRASYVGGSRGDHFLSWDLFPLVAHGFVVGRVRRGPIGVCRGLRGFPGIVLGIEGFVGLPNSKDEVEE